MQHWSKYMYFVM